MLKNDQTYYKNVAVWNKWTDHIFYTFYMLSFKNFTWSTLKYFVSYLSLTLKYYSLVKLNIIDCPQDETAKLLLGDTVIRDKVKVGSVAVGKWSILTDSKDISNCSWKIKTSPGSSLLVLYFNMSLGWKYSYNGTKCNFTQTFVDYDFRLGPYCKYDKATKFPYITTDVYSHLKIANPKPAPYFMSLYYEAATKGILNINMFSFMSTYSLLL